MKIIGITGGVGAGKTQILEYLNNKYGATICMTDEVGKKLQKRRDSEKDHKRRTQEYESDADRRRTSDRRSL